MSAITAIRAYKSASPKLQKMIAADLAGFDQTGRLTIFARRAEALRSSVAQDRYVDDCAAPGVEMCDIATLYEAASDDAMAEAA